MFDDLDKQDIVYPKPRPPQGLSLNQAGANGAAAVKTEDIFSEVDKTVKPEQFRPRDNNSSPASGTVIPAKTGWLKNKLIVLILIFGGLLAVLAGGYFGLKLAVNKGAVKKAAVPEAANNKAETPNLIESKPVEEIQPTLETPPIEPPKIAKPLDTDRDGLTDEEEAGLETNLNEPDTDSDGLTDREEVKVYGTDPLKADTDGDGYADGQEVKNWFNPKGPGKLKDINN